MAETMLCVEHTAKLATPGKIKRMAKIAKNDRKKISCPTGTPSAAFSKVDMQTKTLTEAILRPMPSIGFD